MMKKYILGVISDSDLQDRLAIILKENGWYVPRHTDTELVFLTKGGEKIIFSKISKLNGHISKDGYAHYCRYNNKGEFLGFVDAHLLFKKVEIPGYSFTMNFNEFYHYPAYLNATFKETSIHAVAKDKAYRYDLDFYDNLHVLKNGIALSDLIVSCNAGFAPSLQALHQGLKPEAVAAFVNSPMIGEVKYPIGSNFSFFAHSRPTYYNGAKVTILYGYGDGFHIDRGSGTLIYAPYWTYDGFAHAFESILTHSVLDPFTRMSISLNPNAKAFKNRPTSPYRDSFDLEFITGTSFSDDELSDKMGNDLLYAPRDNYVKGNSFVYIDKQMLVIQFGENIVIIGTGDLVSGDDDFAFLGFRHSDDEVSATGKYFDINGTRYNSYYWYLGELRYSRGRDGSGYDQAFSEVSKNPLSGAPLRGLSWGDEALNTKWIYDKILKTEKHYPTNTTLKVGKKSYDFLHTSLSDGYGLLIEVEEVKNV